LLELFGFETIASLPKNEVIELERSFESFKRKVGTGNTVYYIQIPLSLRQSAPPGTLVASKLKLQSEKVKEFFDTETFGNEFFPGNVRNLQHL
jgi:hypothetical protein